MRPFQIHKLVHHCLFMNHPYTNISLFMIYFQVNPSDVIILEGILIFHDSRVRDLMNMKIFVDAGLSHTDPLYLSSQIRSIYGTLDLCALTSVYTHDSNKIGFLYYIMALSMQMPMCV